MDNLSSQVFHPSCLSEHKQKEYYYLLLYNFTPIYDDVIGIISEYCMAGNTLTGFKTINNQIEDGTLTQQSLNEILIDNDINYRHNPDDYYFSHLHFACFYNNIDATKLLIKNGADINIQDENNMTCTHLAARKKFIDYLNFLLPLKPDLSILDKKILREASFFSFKHLETGNTLLEIIKHEFCQNPIIKQKHGQSSFQYACGYCFDESIFNLFLQYGADIHNVTKYGRTALHITVRLNQFDNFKLLLQQKEVIDDINIQDEDGRTAFHYACMKNNVDMQKILVENGANVELKDNDGNIGANYLFN